MIVNIAILLIVVTTKINSLTEARCNTHENLLTVAKAIQQEILNSNMSDPVAKQFLKHVNVSLTDKNGKTGFLNIKKIKYLLNTRKNANKPQIIMKGDRQSLKKSHFKINNPTKIVIHGWRSDGKGTFVKTVTAEFLKSCDCNIISVDWSHIAKNLIYPIVVAQTKHVGWSIGEFIQFLIDCGVLTNNIYVIGYSMGAHIAGFSQEKLKKHITRITGLDPAFIGFKLGNLQVLGGKGSLSAAHADFVDVIHTNAGVLGFPTDAGHVDFYPNGGTVQPGCNMLDIACSHHRSYVYYAESIVKSKFPSKACSSYGPSNVTMGYDTPSTARGKYCLKTHNKPMYGMRKKKQTCSGNFCLTTLGKLMYGMRKKKLTCGGQYCMTIRNEPMCGVRKK